MAFKLVVTHDPKTFQRLKEPREFIYQTMDEVNAHFNRLRKAGLKRYQMQAVVIEEAPKCQ